VSLATPTKIQRLQGSLYEKAKREPECRFHFLYDKIYREDVLAHAYALCRKNRGASGVDGQTFKEIEEQGREEWLSGLRKELQEKTYRAEPVRRVMIPKEGGSGERPLGLPTIRDRTVQTAAKLVLEPIFEADFDEAAYGYRPGKSAVDAVRHVRDAIWDGRQEVVDADLSKYFDTIPHAELMKCLMRRISDGRVLQLIKMWLKVPVEERDDKGNRRMSGGKKSKRGVPQGGAISPLLATVYMHRFIKAFRKYGLAERYGAELVVYADDFVVLCRNGADEVLNIARRWLTKIGLTLNEDKTSVKNVWREPFEFLGYRIGELYSPRTGTKYIGASPSTKSTKRFRQKVRAILHRGNHQPWGKVRAAVNHLVRGWANDFAYGTIQRSRGKLDYFVWNRVRGFLRRRHKVSGRGTYRFSYDAVFGELGILRMQTLPNANAHRETCPRAG